MAAAAKTTTVSCLRRKTRGGFRQGRGALLAWPKPVPNRMPLWQETMATRETAISMLINAFAQIAGWLGAKRGGVGHVPETSFATTISLRGAGPIACVG